MAKYEHYREVPTRNILGRIFLKAAAWGVLLFGAYQYYTPQSAKDAVADTVASAISSRGTDAIPTPSSLRIALDSGAAPSAMGNPALFALNGEIAGKWYAAQGLHETLMQNAQNATAFSNWLGQCDHLRGESIEARIRGVNDLLAKQVAIREEPEAQRWRTPLETLKSGGGSCEDVAILQYHMLRYLGVAAEKMFLVTTGLHGSGATHLTLMADTRSPGFLKEQWEGIENRAFGSDIPATFVAASRAAGDALTALPNARPLGMNERGVWLAPQGGKLKM